MTAPQLRAETTPRYDALYDKHVLANWIALIADDRDLDAAAVAALAGLDVGAAQSILDGDVRDFSVRALDEALRAVEGRPVPAAVCGAAA